MSLLDAVIEGATDEAVSTGNLLRKLHALTYRLQAEELKTWVGRELNGYPGASSLPKYRGPLMVPVRAVWSGPFGASLTNYLSEAGVPKKYVPLFFRAHLAQPIAELESLSQGDDTEASLYWKPEWVGIYNRLVDERKVPLYEDMAVFSARQILPRTTLVGIIERIRNRALEFALELQGEHPDAGEVGGPTVNDEGVARTVTHFTTNIYGDGNQVAQGENIRQRTQVQKGDLSGLLKAAEGVGLDSAANAELARVVLTGEEERPGKIASFLRRVREGAFVIGTGITADVAADQLSHLVAGYLGNS